MNTNTNTVHALNTHDAAKTATLNYLNGYGDVTAAIRVCYQCTDFSGIVDALATYGPWDKRKRSGELGKRVASLRTLLNRIGGELAEAAEILGQTVTVMTIESKDEQPLGIVPKREGKSKAANFASFIAARKAVHKAITELSALHDVPGFAEFHTAALTALNSLSAMPETIQYTTTSVTGVELQGTVHTPD